ncbi:hypothetical protein LTR10_017669 [Elasticomyces elasticus]|uniref:Uncharacterized protein n=1 Tax=Exophiala sideris TaxID=1016849 RepID=A0ABR0JCF3_9EURO|nr:hypothetical protein LTR10_017669 [Elasticomyces elasticus]KAK5031082.1 hypothetical protein LTS07_004817 [Exophiala sideris]KAK5038804.1 hypothetical protein LTR13_003835 [Exophiala sideris]KAK5060687.1 hypothetical protein LTR69_005286 [Exophiala sideris]KAK5183600.1 hypothetical protein LTR44_003882 [Eurotiomycetes sp. CCFEE 6388]
MELSGSHGRHRRSSVIRFIGFWQVGKCMSCKLMVKIVQRNRRRQMLMLGLNTTPPFPYSIAIRLKPFRGGNEIHQSRKLPNATGKNLVQRAVKIRPLNTSLPTSTKPDFIDSHYNLEKHSHLPVHENATTRKAYTYLSYQVGLSLGTNVLASEAIVNLVDNELESML